VLEELEIDTRLPLEAQRWLVARCMAAVSLAVTIDRDEDYYAALAVLGDSPSEGDERAFARELLGLLGADLRGELTSLDERAGMFSLAELERRLRDQDALLGLLRPAH
jgi:hypothetical protein